MSKTDPKVELRPLTDALPDATNANSHSQRGQRVLETSLRQRGFFRPMAAAGKGVDRPVIKAGNLTQETAVSAGLEDAIFVYTDGSRPIVHVRTDLDPDSPEAALLALEDNRASELSLTWDPAIMRVLAAQLPAEVGDLFSDDELRVILEGDLTGDDGGPQNFDELKQPASTAAERYRVVLENLSAEAAEDYANRIQGARIEQYRGDK